MKLAPVLALGLAFALTACEDNSSNQQKKSENAPPAVSVTVAPASVPEGPVKNTLDSGRFIQATLPITTRDNRELRVTFTAYCETMGDLDNTKKTASGNTKYADACTSYVRDSLEYFAKDRECFEGSIPAVNAAVRNHPGLPQKADDKCHDVYPPNTAPWPEDMMRRTLEMYAEDNLYTVTKIEPVAAPR